MRHRIPWRILIPAFVVIVLIVTARYPAPTTFSVNAVTPVVVFTPSADHRSPWHFKGAQLQVADGSARPFTGSVLVRPSTRVVLERMGKGPFRLEGRSKTGSAVASIHDAGVERPVEVRGYFMVTVDSLDSTAGQTMVLPVIGKLEVGSQVGIDPGDKPVLLQRGTVTMLAHTLIGERLNEAGTAVLELGDYPDLKPLGDARGLVVVDHAEPYLTASFRVIGSRLHVDRFGSAGYAVYASWLERLRSDHVLQGIWAASILVLAWIAKLRTRAGSPADSNARSVHG